MDLAKSAKEKVLSRINEERLISLLSKLLQIRSVVEDDAAEKEISEYLQGYWKKMGLKVFVQDVPQFAEDIPKGPHPQIIGRLKGTGTGKRFMMGGHVDTEPLVHPELWTKDPFSGYVDREEEGPEGKGYIYGMGAANMKQSVASFTEAVHAIIEAGVELNGDLLLAGWVLENIGCLGSQYQVKHWDELGVGPLPDMVLDGEPTNCEVWSTSVGVQDLSITTEGHCAPVGTRHQRRPEYAGLKHINAFDKMLKVVWELKDVRRNFTYQRHHYIEDPIISIGDVKTKVPGKGGRPSLGNSECTIAVDIRYLPGMTAQSIEEDIRRILYRLMVEDPELKASVNIWSHNALPSELPNDHFLHQVLRKAHREIFEEDLIIDTDVKGGASLTRMVDRMKYSASDIGAFCAAGIPGTNYGACKVAIRPDERVSIPQLVKHCKVAVLTTLEICGVK